MTAKRLPRGTRVYTTQMALRIEDDAKQTFDAMAAAAGVTKAVFFEQLMAHLKGSQLSDRGVPRWMPQPEADDNELPMRLSA